MYTMRADLKSRAATKFVEYLKETWFNKLAGVIMLLVGLFPVWIDGDGTALLFYGVIAVYLLFTRRKCFNVERRP